MLTGAASTAKANDDYTLSPLTFRVESGQTIAIFRLNALSDEIYEGNEQLVLVPRATGDGIELRAQPLETTIIDDNDRPTLRLSPVGEVTEGHSTTIEVSLTSILDVPVRVSLAYGVSSTASQSDYKLSEIDAEIAAGKLTATFNLEAVQNELYELAETLILVPSASGVGLEEITGEPGVITIGDDEVQPTVSLESPGQVAEGGSITVIVRLDGALESTVTVELLPTNGNAESDDYTISPASVTILPGATVAEFTLTAPPDVAPTFETTETLTLNPVATIVEGSVSLDTDSRSVPHQVVISESLPVPFVVLQELKNFIINEGQQGVEIRAVLQHLTEFTVTVSLSRGAGSTAENSDFELETGTLEIGAGREEVKFILDITDDELYEGDEELILEGRATGNGLELPVPNPVVMIIDDEQLPTLSLDQRVASIDEGVGVTLTVTLDGVLEVPVTVSLLTGAASTAKANDDYTLSPLTFRIESGQTIAIFRLNALSDEIYEGNEQLVLVSRATGDGIELRAQPLETTIIDENDRPTLQIGPVGEVTEGHSTTIEVSLTSILDVPVRVSLAYGVSSTASQSDYKLSEIDAEIAAGKLTATFNLEAVQNELYELAETLILVPSASGVGLEEITGEPGVITIGDDEVQPTVSLESPGQVAEGGSITVIVRLDGALESTVTVELLPANGNAESDDYTISPASVTILPGATVAEFTLTAPPDVAPTFEATETLTLNPVATIVEGSVSLDTDSRSVPHQVTISESLPVPFVVLQELKNFIINEGQQGVEIRAVLQHLTEFTVTVSLSRGAGSTAENSDFKLETGTLEIGAGREEVKFILDITDDELYEGDEELILEGRATGNGLELHVPNPVVMIIDDEQLPTLSLDQKVASIDEGTGVTLTVTLDGTLEVPVTVSLLTGATSTAKANDDYTLSPLAFRIESGQLTATFRLNTLSDKIYEGNEQLVLIPRATGDGIELRAQPLETTITDENDRPTLQIGPVGEVIEGHSTTIEVSLTSILNVPVRVSLAYGMSSTASQSDYTLSEIDAEIAAGKLTATFSLEAVQNELYELTETLILVPSASGVGLEEITGEPGVITIGDDEAPPTLSFEPLNDLDEGDIGMITVRLNGVALETPLVVTVIVNTVASRINDISPVISPDEYQLIPVVSVIPAGELAATFRLETYHDGRFRGDRTLEIDLVTDNDQVVLAGGPMQVELMELDMVPVLSLDPIPDVLDTRGSFLIEINLSNLLDNDLDLELTTGLVEGSYIAFLRLIEPVEQGRVAVTGIPIGLQTGLITFRPQNVASDQTVTLALQLDDDAINNADLNELEALGLIELGATSRTFRILDRDVKPVLSLDPVGTIAEGSTNEVTVRLDRPLISDLTVSLTIDSAATLALDRPAEEGDYELSRTSFVIPASALLATFSLKSIDDDIYEGDEQFVLRLEHEPLDTDQFDLGQDTQIVTIRDDDPPELILDEVVSPVNEGDSFNLTGQLRGAREFPITLSLNTVSAASTVGSDDWSVTPQTITVPAGSEPYPFSFAVTVEEDSVYEGTERAVFEVTAVGVSEQVLDRESFGLVEINDNDTILEISRITIPEGVTEGETFTVVVELDDALGTYLDVSLVHDGASTAEPEDYQITPPIYRIEAGQMTATLEVGVFDDPLYELTETLVFSITASNTEAGIELPMLSRSIEITEKRGSPPRIVLLAMDDSITEGGDGVTVTVRVNGALEVPLTLSLTTAVTSVAGPDDYSLSPNHIVIPAGYKQENFRRVSGNVRVEVEFRLTADTDDLYEGPEELILDLIKDASADPRIDFNRGTFQRATTIMDVNQTPTLSLDGPTEINEGDSAEYTLSLTGALGASLTVSFARGATSPADTDDYNLPEPEIVILSGNTVAVFTLETVPDDLYENNEQLELVLSFSGAPVELPEIRQTITIRDPKPTLTVGELFRDDPRIEEGDAGVFVLTLSHRLEEALTVSLTVNMASTARYPDEFVFVDDADKDGTVNFVIPAGTREIEVSLQISQDNIYESPETIVFSVSTDNDEVLVPNELITATVYDDDLFPTVSLELSAASVNEGNGVTVTAVLSGSLAEDVEVLLEIVGGTADVIDYVTPSTLRETITAGNMRFAFVIMAAADEVYDGLEPETLELGLSVLRIGTPVTAAVQTLTITDLDTLPTLSLELPPRPVRETDGTLLLTATLSGGLDEDVELSLSVGGDVGGGDYSVAQPVTISAGDVSGTFEFVINDDRIYEGTEMVELTLSGKTTGAVVETLLPVSAEFAIIDDERPVGIMVISPPSVLENDEIVIEVELTTTAPEDVTVTLVVAETGNAKLADYQLLDPLTRTISVGDMATTFRIRALPDNLYEGTETIDLQFHALGGIVENTLNIRDANEAPTVRIASLQPTTVTEGASVDILVELDGALIESDIVVDFAVSGTAVEGTDYTVSGRSVTIPSGRPTATIILVATDDTVVYSGDAARTVVLSLAGTSGGVTLGDSLTHTVTIVDNDVRIGLTRTAYSVPESAGGVSIAIGVVGGRLTEEITLNYVIEPDTASETEDYGPRTGNVKLSAGSTGTTLAIAIVNDDLYENADTFSVRLVEPEDGLPLGVELVTAMTVAAVTITNDDEIEIGFVEGMYTFPENQGRVTAQVRYSGSQIAPGVEVEVYYSTTVVIGDSIDINDVSGTLVLGSNQRVYDINFPITDDNEFSFVNDEYTMTLRLLDVNAGLRLQDGREKTGLTVLTDDVLDFGFSVTEYEVNEASGTVELEVRILGNTLGAGERVVVRYSTTPGSATSSDPSDFEPVTGVVTLSPTATVVTFEVPITNDEILEDSESFVVTLSTVDFSTLRLSPKEAMVTILDDNDPVTVGFGSSLYSVREDQVAVLDVGVLSGGLERDINVEYDIRGGSAVAGTDYEYMTGTVTVSYDVSRTIRISLLDDDIFDPGETFTVVLTGHDGPSSLTFGLTEAVVRIDDDDSPPTVSLYEIADVSEGETVTVIARLSGKIAEPVVLTLAPEIEGEVDYRIVTPTVVIRAGDETATFELYAIDDGEFDGGPERKTVKLSVLDDVVGLVDDAQTFTIFDAQSLRPVLSLDPIAGVDEGDNRVVTARLHQPLSSALTITVLIRPALDPALPADNPEDYVLSTSTIRIPAGEELATFTIDTVEDDLYEGDEEFRLVLNPVGDSVDPGTLTRTVTIRDNDLVTVGFEDIEYTVVEGGLSVTVVVVADRPAVRDEIRLSYETIDGSARASGGDYTTTRGAITLTASTTRATIEILITDDSAFEYDEEFTVVLSAPASGLASFVSISGAVTRVTIENDDEATIGFEETTYSVSEGAGRVELPVVVLVGSIGDDTEIEVPYSVVAGTAEAGSDYVVVNNMLTLSSSTSSAIEILITDDDAFEYDETFMVVLGTPVGVVLSTTATIAEVTITNDDTVEIGFESNEYSVLEDSGTISVTFGIISGRLADGITVNVEYAFSDDGATRYDDYTPVPGSVALSAQMTGLTINVPIIPDARSEEDESFLITLTTTTNDPEVSLPLSQTMVTIINDEFGPTITLVAFERDSEKEGIPLVIGVRLSEPIGVPLTVELTIDPSSTAVEREDFLLSGFMDGKGSYTIPAGVTEIAIATFIIVPDQIPEPTETVILVLSVPGGEVDLGEVERRLEIPASDFPEATLRPADLTITEGDPSQELYIDLTRATFAPVEFRLRSSGDAGASDYMLSSLVLPAGASSLTVTVSVLDDAVYDDGTEMVDFELEIISGPAELGSLRHASLTIEDNESLPTVSLDEVDDITEGEVTTVTARLSGALDQRVTVDIKVMTTTVETSSSDYEILVQPVDIPAGVLTATFVIKALDDSEIEDPETLVLELRALRGPIDVVDGIQTLTILDADSRPSLSLDSIAPIDEGDSRVVTARLNRALPDTLTIMVTTLAADPTRAADNLDYGLSSELITIPANALEVTFAINAIDDDVYEGDEEFLLILSPVEDVVELGTLTRTVTIREGDAVPNVSIDTVGPVSESGTVTLTVRFSGLLKFTSTVDVSAVGGTASLLDYELSSRRIVIPGGELTETLELRVLPDDIYEETETLELGLSGTDGIVNLGVSEQTVELKDDDDVPQVSLDPIGPVTEAQGVTLGVRLSGKAGFVVTVELAVDDSSTASPADYVLSSSSVEIPAGSLTATVLLQARRDTIIEVTETVVLDISALRDGRLLSESRSELEIIDDARRSVVSLVLGETEVEEGVTLLVLVELDEAIAEPVTVELEIDPSSTATEGEDEDFVLSRSSGTIEAGQRDAVIASLSIIDDQVDEFTEMLTLLLKVPGGEVDLGVGEFTLTILDNDPADVVTATLRVASETVTEGSSEILYIELSEATTEDVTVTLTVPVGSTATGGADYELLPLSPYVLTAGETELAVEISTVVDSLYEGDETVEFVISALSGPAVASTVSGAVTVTIVEEVPTVSLDLSSESVIEGGEVTVSAELSVGYASEVDVLLEIVGGSAGFADYITPSTLRATLSAGATSVAYVLTATADSVYEGFDPETLELRASVSGLGDLITSSVRTLIIEDDDEVTIGFVGVPVSVNENTGAILTVAILEGELAPGVELSVDYETVDDSARARIDYALSSGTLMLSSELTETMFVVSIIDDVVSENEEQFMVSLSGAPVRVVLDPMIAVVTIEDDEPAPVAVIGFNSESYSVSEEFSRTVLTVSVISGVLMDTVTLNYETVDISATSAADYELLTNTLTLSPLVTSGTITVSVIDDSEVESSEIFFVDLTRDALPNSVSLSPFRASVTIEDDDVEIGFDQVTYNVDEAVGTVELTVRVIGGVLEDTVTLNYVPVGGSATTIEDYEIVTKPLMLSSLITSVTIKVSVIDDNVVEGVENFFVDITGVALPANVRLVPSRATVTIEDNDVVIGFKSTEYIVNENDGLVELTVEVISGTLTQDITLNYATEDDTATSPEDYSSVADTLTLSPTMTSVTFSVSIVDNAVVELAEMFTVALSASEILPVGVVLTRSVTTVTIIDNDVEIGFEQVTYTVDESSGTVEFTVKVFNGSLGRSVTLTYETTDDTARAGEDYTLLSNTLTLSSESAAMTFTVSITDDTLFETDELFSVSLSGAPTGVILIADTVEVTIEDNETATIGFVQTSYEILENGGRQAVEVEIKSGVLAEGVILSVGVSTADGTATAPGDYIATDDTIDFSSANTRGSIVVPINFDQILEGKERFEVALNLLSDSTLAGRVTVEPLTATVTITDELVTVGFVNSPYVVKEGAAGISVTIGILSEGIVLGKGITLAVNYEISDESASAGQDYQNISGTVVFEAATKTQVVFIPITDDSLFEGDESFRITLTDVEASIDGVSLGDDAPTVQLNPKTAKVTILDDDTVEIGFDPVTYVVSEASGTVTLTARILSGSLGRVVTLTYATADGSAVAGTDYTLTTGTLTLSDTTTSFTFTVRILEDIDVELAQTFTVSLSGAPAGVALTSSVAIVTILDNDEAPIPVVEVGFDPVSYVVDEDSGTVELTVSVLSGVLMETITLSYAVSDVSTTVSDDYTVTVAMLELSLMTTSVTISVDIIDDTSDEPEEEFTFTLLDAPVGISFNPTVATVTIVDNDEAPAPVDVEIGFDSATYRVNEGSGTVELTVSVLSGVLTETIALSYAVSDVSTTVSDDYTVTVAMLELSLMTTSVTISVDIIDDTSDEPEEEFTFTLLDAPVGVSFNPTVATVTIVDNDEAPEPVGIEIGFDSATYRVNEGSGTVELTVSVLSGVLTEAIRLSYAVSDVSTTVSDDYTVIVAMLELSLMTTSVTISVDIIDDTSDEPEEEFTFTLLDAPVGVSFNPTAATVTIVDNDAAVAPDPVVIGFDSATYRVNEGSGTVELTVSVLSGVLTEAIRLSYAVSDVSTTVSDDYTVTVAMLELSLMTTSVTISVDIIDDTSDEPEEEFTFTLLDAPVGISFNPTVATVTIVDNDEAPGTVGIEVGFDSATYRVNEGSGTVELTVSVLSGVLTEAIKLSYAVSDVSTTVSDDYTVTVAMLELSLMTSSVTIIVDIIDDTSDEPEEEFTFTLLDAPVGVSFNPTVATVTIVDNDAAVDPDPVVVGFDSATYRVNEGSGTVELMVSVLSGVLTETIRLSYAVSDVSTTVSDDYTVTVAMLELSLMTTSVTISVDIIDDTSDEPEEEFTFTLLDAPVGVSFNPTVATVTIVDNDAAVDPDPVVVGFDSATYRVNEGSGTVELTVSVLSGVLTEAIRLSYAVSDVSTTVSDDYTVTVAMLELSLMTSSVTISVDIIDDTSDEPEEEFTFTLLDAPVGVSFNPTVATVTIVDNDAAVDPDPVVVGFDSATYRVNEGSGTVELTVSVLSGVLTETLRLSYAVSDVSTTVSDDYTVTVAMLELSLMTTSVTIIVDIIDDTSDEPEEEFMFTLLDAPVGISFNPTVATVTIVDNDEAPAPVDVEIGFDSATYRVNEGSGTVDLTVSVLSGVLTETLRLNYAVSDVSTTVSDDYTVTVAMLELSLMTTSVTISVDIIDDTSDEPEEEFTFTLLDAPVGVSFNPTVATVTIVDNDEAPAPVDVEIGFDSATYRVNEGSGTVELTVSVLSGVLTEAIRLSYAVSDVSTTVSDDYTVTVAMLELSLMTSSVTISVDIVDDTSDELEEEFTVTLLDAPVGISFNPTVATVTIVDNDEAPAPVDVEIGFDSATYRVNEGSGTVELTVSVLSGVLTEALRLSYAVSDVSTTVSDDYTVTVAMLELSLLTTSVTIIVDIIDDTSDEPEEEFTFTLLDAPVGVSFNPTVATVTIVDNDAAVDPDPVVVGFDSATYRVNEGSGTVELTVSVLSGVLTETLRLNYAVSDVSTTVSDDYTVTVAMLELSLMTSSVTIIVDIIDDTSDEPEEEFTVTLLDAPVGVSFNPTRATVTIVDNDEAPDPVVVGFDFATYRVNEGSGTVDLTVSVLSGVLTEALRLSYAVSDVSTTVSDDYTVTVAMLELSLMTTSVTISVDIIDDTSDEPEEEFTFTLLDAPVGISFNPTVATVTIVDNDEAPDPVVIGFDSATYRVNEGSGTVELTVSVLSGVLTETLRLSYAVSDVSTTVSDDYTVTVAILELSLLTTSVTIIVDIIDDTSDEPEEEFTFTLLDAPVGISFNPTVATVTIVDNDEAPAPVDVEIGFDSATYRVNEGSGTVELTVSVISGVLTETLRLSYAVSDVSTTVSDDYTVTVAMLELSLMTSSVTIIVDIIDDTSDEPEEEFTFTLLDAPVGISFNPTATTVTIVDNDEAPDPVVIGFDSATYRVNEGSGTVDLTVSVLSGVLTETLRLSYAVSDVSTTVSDDYTVTVAMLELSLMTSSVTISVDIVDDTSDELEEEFTVTLLDAPVGISFNPTVATVTIVDNDEAPDPVVVGFDSATYRVNEGSGTVELTVSVISGVLTETLRLNYAVSDVSTTVSDDYTVTVNMLELSLMTSSVTIIVDIIDDTSDEPEEEFTFTLLDAPVGVSFNPTVATVTIVDNDEAPSPVGIEVGFDSATYRVNEGSGTVELTVSVLSGVLTEAIRLSYAVSDVSTTVSDDYTVTVAMLELSLMTTSVTISVDIIDDTSDEPEEEFTFTLLDAPVGVSFNPTVATVTIVDNDEAPAPVDVEIGFDSATYRVNEGSGTVELTVSVLSGVLTEAIRLSYAVSDVSTTVSDDYTVTVAMLELSLMTSSVTISVDIIDDTSDEPEEEFTFTLLDAPVGVSFNPTVATVTIVDNDEALSPG